MRVMFLEGLGDYKCDTGMSVENVPAVVDIKNNGGTIYCTKIFDWVDGGPRGGEDCGKEEECSWTVYSQVEVRNVLGTSCCCKRVNIVEKK